MSTSPAANISTTHIAFPVRKLPIELRRMVYMNRVALAPGKQAPPLLLAVGVGGEVWEEDYKECQMLYKKHNYVVTSERPERI